MLPPGRLPCSALDNTANRKGVANENYARELMELHTLGVHGGYTQRDVKEVARCLTGWTVEKHWHRGRFQFDEGTHDNGVKHVLGVTLAAGGVSTTESGCWIWWRPIPPLRGIWRKTLPALFREQRRMRW